MHTFARRKPPVPPVRTELIVYLAASGGSSASHEVQLRLSRIQPRCDTFPGSTAVCL